MRQQYPQQYTERYPQQIQQQRPYPQQHQQGYAAVCLLSSVFTGCTLKSDLAASAIAYTDASSELFCVSAVHGLSQTVC